MGAEVGVYIPNSECGEVEQGAVMYRGRSGRDDGHVGNWLIVIMC